ncbi:cation-translocating P-type ATPase [Cyclobacterium jeungdonense]|uniref:HAD-IC family P-type ATPase n=1 Tax=Cyclobacterium jeungdonense TaxID=708087 RepID=A0ABT8C784_9BACT|nr:HAD-IC family P-type ATPase [Cyclobacterium jeungdonense]MDN3688376.1 HAD-IC family P-type ATPase [Cyclobacterium jeungdonense]
MIQIPDNPHRFSTEEIKKKLQTSESGISTQTADQLRQVYGWNELPDPKKKSVWFLLFRQFQNIMVYILLVASLISFLTGHHVDVIVILAIVVINILIGFVQEFKAENSVQALKNLLVPKCAVIRNGKLITILSRELVPGDVMHLSEGDLIPADGILFRAEDTRTMESSLTGEPVPIEKNCDPSLEDSPLADRKNMVWKGTFVSGGNALAWVIATGPDTQIGKIAASLKSIPAKDSSFKIKSNRLAKQMAILAILSAIILFLVGYFFQEIPVDELLLISIAALVSAIPEGLPAVLSIVLAIGANRMSKKNAIIREISATESLGSVSTIVTDKTGTLTQNTMTIKKLWQVGGEEIGVSGEGWETKGEFSGNEADIKALNSLLEIAAHCNQASVSVTKKGRYQITGDPTEAAFSVLARKAGIQRTLPIVKDFPFSTVEKFRSTIVEKSGKRLQYYIGAPEKILEKSAQFQDKDRVSTLTEQHRSAIREILNNWSKNSFRVLALAFHPEGNPEPPSDKGWVFCGLAAMVDPPRPEVQKAVKACHQAGIRVIMATGDHSQTAFAIGKEVGIVLPGREQVLTDAELQKLSKEDFTRAIREVDIFSRLSPLMKLKIAKSLQESGELVAMTGDGVNDAPALRQANVGVSMGIMGTDVAREASLVVLADDNFATIVQAVEQGRIVFNNARRTSFFLITTNFAEIVTLIVAIALGFAMPLTATQILWINLVTDGFCDKALATEKGTGNELNSPPIHPKENIINREILPFLFLNTFLMTGMSLFAFQYYLPESMEKARTVVFIVLAFSQLFNVFNMRSIKGSAFKVGLFSNKWVNYALVISIVIQVLIIEIPALASLFNFHPLSPGEFLSWVALSSLVLWVNELYKLIRRKL